MPNVKLNPYILKADRLETQDNKTSIIDKNSTNEQYPSAKAVYEALAPIFDSKANVFDNTTETAKAISIKDSAESKIKELRLYGEGGIIETTFTESDGKNLVTITDNGDSLTVNEEIASKVVLEGNTPYFNIECLAEYVDVEGTYPINFFVYPNETENNYAEQTLPNSETYDMYTQNYVYPNMATQAIESITYSVTLNIQTPPIENPTISVYGKNLCNNIFYQARLANGVAYVYQDFVEVTSPYITKNPYSGACVVMPVIPNQTYRFSGNVTGHVYKAIYYAFYTSLADVTSYIKEISHGYAVGDAKFTTPENAKYVVLFFGSDIANTTLTFDNVQVELGTTVTEYEPYKEPQSVTIPYSFAEGDNLTLENGKVNVRVADKSNEYTEIDNLFSLSGTGGSSDLTLLTLNQDLLVGAKSLNAVINGNATYSDMDGYTYTVNITNLIPNKQGVIGTVTWKNSVTAEEQVQELVATDINEETGFPNTIQIGYIGDYPNDSSTLWLPLDIIDYTATVSGTFEADITDTNIGQALLALHTNHPNTTILSDADLQITYIVDVKSYIDNKFSELQSMISAIESAVVNNI